MSPLLAGSVSLLGMTAACTAGPGYLSPPSPSEGTPPAASATGTPPAAGSTPAGSSTSSPTPTGGGGRGDAGSTTTAPPVTTGDASTGDDAGGSGALPGWTLTWSDEFDGPDGTAIDGTKWNTETGNAGFGNNQELEYYTAGTANAVVTGGSLVITATTDGASALKCQYGTCKYTSARVNTQGKFEQAYGRFESRLQIPRGQGLWPAFWMLGNDIGSAGWPTCGEIDIMENIGSQPAENHGSLHGPGYSGGHPLTGATSIPSGALADSFHVYAIEWAPDTVSFYVDDTLYETRTNADVPAGDKWVYDHPFFIILNVAVGGTFPGPPNATTVFPQTMTVDYVRVYTKNP